MYGNTPLRKLGLPGTCLTAENILQPEAKFIDYTVRAVQHCDADGVIVIRMTRCYKLTRTR